MLKKGVVKNFAKFTEKYLCWSLTHRFSCEFCEIFKNNFFTEHLNVLLQNGQNQDSASFNSNPYLTLIQVREKSARTNCCAKCLRNTTKEYATNLINNT